MPPSRPILAGYTSGLILLALLLASCSAWAEEGGHISHWGYGPENGPAHWADLDPGFGLCASGRRQSPIDITGEIPALPSAVSFAHRPGVATVTNNGHTIQVDVKDGGAIVVHGETYTLAQFHFHTPSENTFDGRHYPMVAHLVHKSAAGELAVVAVMFREGAEGFVDALPRPRLAGETQALAAPMNAAALLPEDAAYYAFDGSLTTPPCSEGVRWIVMKMPVEIGAAALADFAAIMHANNRPTNPLHGRVATFSE